MHRSTRSGRTAVRRRCAAGGHLHRSPTPKVCEGPAAQEEAPFWCRGRLTIHVLSYVVMVANNAHLGETADSKPTTNFTAVPLRGRELDLSTLAPSTREWSRTQYQRMEPHPVPENGAARLSRVSMVSTWSLFRYIIRHCGCGTVRARTMQYSAFFPLPLAGRITRKQHATARNACSNCGNTNKTRH